MGEWCVDLDAGARPSLCPAAIGRTPNDEDPTMNDNHETAAPAAAGSCHCCACKPCTCIDCQCCGCAEEGNGGCACD
jgi:hypothetical protein